MKVVYECFVPVFKTVAFQICTRRLVEQEKGTLANWWFRNKEVEEFFYMCEFLATKDREIDATCTVGGQWRNFVL